MKTQQMHEIQKWRQLTNRNLTCIYKKTVQNICCQKDCARPSFCCSDDSCNCKYLHRKCKKIPSSVILPKIYSKVQQNKKIANKATALFNTIIDQVIESCKQSENSIRKYRLTNQEVAFVDLIQANKSHTIKGNLVNKVIRVADSGNDYNFYQVQKRVDKLWNEKGNFFWDTLKLTERMYKQPLKLDFGKFSLMTAEIKTKNSNKVPNIKNQYKQIISQSELSLLDFSIFKSKINNPELNQLEDESKLLPNKGLYKQKEEFQAFSAYKSLHQLNVSEIHHNQRQIIDQTRGLNRGYLIDFNDETGSLLNENKEKQENELKQILDMMAVRRQFSSDFGQLGSQYEIAHIEQVQKSSIYQVNEDLIMIVENLYSEQQQLSLILNDHFGQGKEILKETIWDIKQVLNLELKDSVKIVKDFGYDKNKKLMNKNDILNRYMGGN